MNISRVLNLNEEEFNKLIAAGELLGAINKALEASEADELSSGLAELVKALNTVTEKLVK